MLGASHLASQCSGMTSQACCRHMSLSSLARAFKRSITPHACRLRRFSTSSVSLNHTKPSMAHFLSFFLHQAVPQQCLCQSLIYSHSMIFQCHQAPPVFMWLCPYQPLSRWVKLIPRDSDMKPEKKSLIHWLPMAHIL